MRQAYTDQERARVREMKARGLSGKAIQTRLRIEREENYRAQVQQVNELYNQKLAAGMTPAEAATSQGFLPTNRPPSQYTVADGDTVDSIAQQFNMTPQQLLENNKDMRQLRTGLVINTQQPNIKGDSIGAEFFDRLLQSMGLPVIYQQRSTITPTIWGNPNPNAPLWKRAARGLAYVPPVGIGIEAGARVVNLLSGNRYTNQWWDWTNYQP